MQAVRSLLSDPSWWFSAVFVGVFLSIVAGFAKDYIQSILGRVSARYRETRANNLEHHKKVVKAVAENQSYLVITFIRTLISVIATSTILIMLLILITNIEARQLACEANPNAKLCVARITASEIGLIVILTLTLLRGMSVTIKRFRLSNEALACFRTAKNLPREFL